MADVISETWLPRVASHHHSLSPPLPENPFPLPQALCQESFYSIMYLLALPWVTILQPHRLAALRTPSAEAVATVLESEPAPFRLG